MVTVRSAQNGQSASFSRRRILMSDRKDVETDVETDAEKDAKDAEAKAAETRAAEMTKAAQAKREKWTAAHTRGAETTDAEAQTADAWPKIYGNINVPPLIVHSPDEAEQLSSARVEVDLAGHEFALTPAP